MHCDAHLLHGSHTHGRANPPSPDAFCIHCFRSLGSIRDASQRAKVVSATPMPGKAAGDAASYTASLQLDCADSLQPAASSQSRAAGVIRSGAGQAEPTWDAAAIVAVGIAASPGEMRLFEKNNNEMECDGGD